MIIMTGATVFGQDASEYEVLDYLGSGSFGTVYKVKAKGDNVELAMKFVQTPFTEDSALKAFLNEGNLAVGIEHPNVIKYLFFHDGTTYAGLPPYILMEYANNGTLHDQLTAAKRENKQFTNDQLLGMFRQLAAGMRAINERLIHRDIKPDNILVSNNVLKISDFGLSKVVVEATRKSTFKGFGCIAYMAPEAWRFEKNTVQLDIYAMGMVFYQLATLHYAFDIKTPDPQKWMEAHFYAPVQRPDNFNPELSPQITQVIMKMLEKDSTRRFSDWANIEKLLCTSTLSDERSNNLVSVMLKRRLEQDTAIQKSQAEQQRQTDQWAQQCKIVLYQAENILVPPITDLVRNFNETYAGTKATFSGGLSGQASLSHEVRFPSGNRVTIQFEVIDEQDFIRQVPFEDYGQIHYREVNQNPRVNQRRVLGWGIINGADGRGFNVLLVERPDELYGEFFMMLNKAGLFSGRNQPPPDPFAFEFGQLEEGVRMIKVINKFHSDVKPFDTEAYVQFVAEYV